MNFFSQVIVLLIIAIVITLHVSVYLWTKELEKQGCECSSMWQRDVVNILAIAMIVMILFNVLVNGKHPVIITVKFLSSIASFIYFALIIDYVKRLKEMECKCSEDWRREFAYIYSIVWYSIVALVALVIIFAGVGMKIM